MSLGTFIFGLLMIAAGVLSLKFNYQLVGMFSRQNVFEQYLGAGSTYPIFKLLSVAVVIAGIFVMFGLHDDILGGLADTLF